MKTKILLIAIVTMFTSTAFAAEFKLDDAQLTNPDAVESRTQLKLFPGITRTPKKSIVLHMAEQPSDTAGILNLNSSLSNSPNQNETYINKNSLDDIQVTNNNIFELRF